MGRPASTRWVWDLTCSSTDMILRELRFVGGVPRNDHSAPPPFLFSPNQDNARAAARNKEGAGSYIASLRAGSQEAGAAQAAG
jgi:hypothetical protein